MLIVAKVVGGHEIDDYAGLAQRSPLLGAALTCALLSLAGVPPFIGFFGKFMLLGSAFDLAHPELLWVGASASSTVVVAPYYYLRVVLKRIYAHEPRSVAPIAVPRAHGGWRSSSRWRSRRGRRRARSSSSARRPRSSASIAAAGASVR